VVAEQYIRRIDTLQAVPEFNDLRAIRSLRLHPLRGDREGEYAMTLHGRWRLILRLDVSNSRLIVQEVTNHYGD
jgi:proteic killer suppression protein